MYKGATYLFDTGAHLPVWCSGAELFAKVFPEAQKTEQKTHLSGFGEGETEAGVFIIPTFTLQADETVYRIKNLYVAVVDYDRIRFDFILSSTMFSKTDYTISNSKKSLKILFDREELYCTPIRKKSEVDKITVWSQ